MHWSIAHDTLTGKEYIAVDQRGEDILCAPLTLAQGAVYPELARIRDCSHAVACAVGQGHAAPAVLDQLEDTVRRAMWVPAYRPVRYEPAKS